MKKRKPNTGGLYARSMRASVAVGLLAALLTSVYAPDGFSTAGAYLLFLGWSLSNLALWRLSLREILGRRRFFLLLPILLGKTLWIGVLFLLCYALSIGKNSRFFFAFLLGFNTPFLVLLLKAWGQALFSEPVGSADGSEKQPLGSPDENAVVDE